MAVVGNAKRIEGIVAVMLTPFHDDGTIDYAGLERLIDWYLANGVDVLFAVCQSSEMLFMTLEERVSLSRFVVEKTRGRVPVVSSGHISDSRDAQLEELRAIGATGADAVILVTNRIDPENAGEAAFKKNLEWLLDRLPEELPLGLYECPAPYRRVLTDAELMHCVGTGRFVALKDVCCDLETIRRRVRLAEGTPLAVINAIGSIALEAMQAGSKGYSGVFTNFHPDLYAWMYRSWRTHETLARELSTFLVASSVTELMGYPAIAKLYHNMLGTFSSIATRAIDYDIRERFWWGGESVLKKIMEGTDLYRRRIGMAD